MEFVVFTCYLPPESYPWGRYSSSFFTHLLTQIYAHSDNESIIICGYFNSRLGKTQDCNDCKEKLPPRTITDNIQNQHGNSLLELLNDSRCCVLKGRYGDGSNENTFHSTRGKSIVDYIFVPHDVLKLFKNFRIASCQKKYHKKIQSISFAWRKM